MSRVSDGTAYAGAKVLVLGASGFIGRRVTRRLENAGADLTLAVLRASDADPFPRAKVQVGDLSVAGTATAIVRNLRPAIVFNLAGYGINRFERDESLAYRINADLPAELAEACDQFTDSQWPGRALVHVGSALEYGTAGGNLDEECGTESPTELYGRSKLAGTTAVHQKTDRAVTARLFTVYGPGEMAGRLLPSLIEASRTGARLALTEGRQLRDFTYVDDVAEALLRIGTLPAASARPVFNVATGILTSVRDFVLQAAGLLGIERHQLDFGAIPSRPEEMTHDPVSVERLLCAIGWKPSTGILDGVRLTIECFREDETLVQMFGGTS